MEPQRILTRLRAVLFELEASRPEDWHDCAAHSCEKVLNELGASEEALGLRAWVQLRAHRHLGQQIRIASPAGSLRDIFGVHKRLLRARATSWEALRAEWQHLLRLRKGYSENDALRHIEAARCDFLRSRVARALQRVKRALARQNVFAPEKNIENQGLGSPTKMCCHEGLVDKGRRRFA